MVTCPATAGAGCIAAGGVMTALGAGAGAGLGSALGGGTRQEVSDDGLSAIGVGAVGGAGKFVSGLKGFL